MAPSREDHRQGHRDVAQLAVDNAAHDRLGEDVEQVGAHRQDALDAGAHQGRSDDEAASGADAAGDQAGAQADEDRDDEDPGGIEGRAVGLLAAQDRGQGPGDLIGEDHPAQDHRDGQQAQEQDPPAVAKNGVGHIDFPTGVGLRPHHHEAAPTV